MKRRLLWLLSLMLLFTSCGYFNSLYNARREFANAERARAAGQTSAARDGYTGAIDKAARSYRKYPRGRWSDDALYLIARARLELREYPAARAAAVELLSATRDQQMRADAHAIAGASAYELGDIDQALVHLDSAMTGVSSGMRGRAHLWRARAHRHIGDAPRAWADLEAVPAEDPHYANVQLERIAFGITQRDSARTGAGFASVLMHRDARQHMDTLADLALSAIGVFGAGATRQMLNAELPDWLGAARDSLALIRAELAMRAGDTLTATTELTELSSRSARNVANAARIKVGRAELRAADELGDLRTVRSVLLPAIADVSVPPIIRNMRIVEALVQKAQRAGQPLALFAAAEIARDDLNAPLLARQLFITFVDVAPQTPWSAKALLAAIALEPDSDEAAELRTRLLSYQSSPYMQALDSTGADGDVYASAEERLQRSLLTLRSEGALLADQEDVAVGRVVATLDSMRVVARTDSTRIACGLMIDTLALAGLRADSVRGACMRADTIRIAEYLKIDTMLWRGGLPSDTGRARRRTTTTTPRPVRPDTIR